MRRSQESVTGVTEGEVEEAEEAMMEIEKNPSTLAGISNQMREELPATGTTTTTMLALSSKNLHQMMLGERSLRMWRPQTRQVILAMMLKESPLLSRKSSHQLVGVKLHPDKKLSHLTMPTVGEQEEDSTLMTTMNLLQQEKKMEATEEEEEVEAEEKAEVETDQVETEHVSSAMK
jgi:hypothetical protein